MAGDRPLSRGGDVPTAWSGSAADLGKTFRLTADPPDDGKAIVDDFPQAKLMQHSRLGFERLPPQERTANMGRSRRNAITGEITVTLEENWPNFHLVDLWKRHYIEATLAELFADEYLFLPVALKYRTWLYHGMYQNKHVSTSAKDSGMVGDALGLPCIDAPVVAGRWSPVMCYGPVLLILMFSTDLLALLPGMGMLIFLYVLSKYFNTIALYRYLRLVTLVPRLGYLGLLFVRIETVGVAIFILVAIILLVDILRGDLAMLIHYRHTCSYEVAAVLPGRVFVCKRHGGMSVEDAFGYRGGVSANISGLGKWPSDMYLIADIDGVLAELRPMKREDIVAIYEENSGKPTGLKYTALDTYGFHMPGHFALASTYQELMMLKAALDKSLPMDSLLRAKAPPAENDAWGRAPAPSVPSMPKGQPGVMATNDVVETNF